jgi:hypothetical protein
MWPPETMQHLTNPCNADTNLAPTTISGGRAFGSVLRISPERYADGTACTKRRKSKGGAVTEDHETLFHELVHALRQVTRTGGKKAPLNGGLRDHDNFEEFIAVLVTNIYASANGKTGLRGGHRGYRPLPGALEDSFGFFEISTLSFPLIEHFCDVNESFCKPLSEVEATFNPIAAFYQDAAKARRLSEGAKAKERDAHGDALRLLENIPFFPGHDISLEDSMRR